MTLKAILRERRYAWIALGFATASIALGLGYAAFTNIAVEHVSEQNFESGVVKAEIGGHRFDVPVAYFYREGLVKYGNWPNPLPERVSVEYLSIDALLPDLRPYSAEETDIWDAPGRGPMISITLSTRDYSDSVGQRLARAERHVVDGEVVRSEIYGLAQFESGASREYYPIGENERNLEISCPKATGEIVETCMASMSYLDGVGIIYYFSNDYISSWREIHISILEHLANFRLNNYEVRKLRNADFSRGIRK